jgi:hypothetical protein
MTIDVVTRTIEFILAPAVMVMEDHYLQPEQRRCQPAPSRDWVGHKVCQCKCHYYHAKNPQC